MRQNDSARQVRGLLATLCLCCALLAACSRAEAHPLSQGALDVVVHPDRVAVRARVTIEEVIITDLTTTPLTASPDGKSANLDEMYVRHANYLAQHVMVSVDGAPLAGRVVRAAAPSSKPVVGQSLSDQEHVVYELEFARDPAQPGATPPAKVAIRQDVLVGASVTPGVTWEASYVVRIATAGGPATEGLLLTSAAPLEYACDWTASGTGGSGNVGRWRMFRDYVAHGIHHILGGYDHLLFISALVLAARSVWDLVKVVTAFTVAHTITLALAALKLVSLPSAVVEPMIAASIVFVALQNVLWPDQSRGRARLAVAFGFGLFHGLGFAGGLLEAMQGMSGVTIGLAIAAFSLGVEIGHQMIVLPLFAALKLARRTRAELAERDRVSLLALRYGSAAICLAGMYYLVGALHSAFLIAGQS